MTSSSSIVIKVRFGETLRRLNAVIDDKKLVMDIVMLKEKIRSLFGFGSDVDFTMTYVDEDGDAVTLADDNDLQDVVRQSLNPLRITVNLTSGTFSGSTGSSTPLVSPQSQLPLRTLNPRVSEVLKSIPEPLLEALAKIPLDLASKASSSSPAVAELVEKMKELYSSQILPSIGGSMVHPTTGGPSNVNATSSTVKDSKVQVNPEAEGLNPKKTAGQVDLNNLYFEKKDSTSNGSLNEPLKQDGTASLQYNKQPNQMSKHLQDKMAAQAAHMAQVAADVNGSTNDSCSSFGWPQGLLTIRQRFQDTLAAQQARQLATEFRKNTNDSGFSLSWAQEMLNAGNQCPFSEMPLTSDSGSQGHHRPSQSPHSKRYSFDNNGMGSIFHRGVCCDGCGAHPITGPRFKSKVKADYDLCDVCFARMGNAADYIKMDLPANGFRHQFTPHRGVRCDGCGADPITGPRFKSKVKDDYDLCDGCFAKMGNAADYIRMDLPANVFRHQFTPFTVFYDPALRIPTPTLPHPVQVPTVNQSRPKLDSQFVLDVNILDGTVMAPLTTFTKIWRMRNNGSATWPYCSQLQWIGGDQLIGPSSVKIPVDGLQVDKEIDIAVNFTAPSLPGRYVSYWRMATPLGQKFGQQVWVLIQVDAALKNLGETINLNLPPVVHDPVTVNQDYLVDNALSGNNITTDSENTTGVRFRINDSLIAENTPAVHFPTNDSMIMDDGFVSSTTANLSPPLKISNPLVLDFTKGEAALGSSHPAGPTVPSGLSPKAGADTEPISYPTVDFSVMPPVMPVVVQRCGTIDFSAMPPVTPPAMPVVVQPSGSGSEKVSNNEEQALVKDLEQMGFKQLDLNKEVLRKNNYDLEKSIDDLCGAHEWDPMLDELREMGFADDGVNRRLLKKNNGSIKRVVMDLIHDEKA